MAAKHKMSAKNQSDKKLTCQSLLLLLALSLLFLLPRLSWSNFVNADFLWGEDGNIFIQQANSMGVSALWQPYSGYLHLYPRFVMLIASAFQLAYQPQIMLAGWFLAYLFMFAVLIHAANNFGANLRSIFFLIILVSLQPNNGEIFFNLTNAQSLLGVSLSILTLTTSASSLRPSLLNIVILFLLGLTGPYSIVLLPVLIIKAIVLNDFKKNYWLYLSILVCALIQGLLIVFSNRLNLSHTQEWTMVFGMKENRVYAPIETSELIAKWSLTFLTLWLFYATQNAISLFSVLCFWFIAVTNIFKKGTTDSTEKFRHFISILLLISAGLFIAAGIFTFKKNSLEILDLGNGCRYTWIPYTLIFFSALCATRRHPIKQAFLFLFALIFCIINFDDNLRKNLLQTNKLAMQFKSFANFSQYRNVIIPINPITFSFPGPSITLPPDLNKTRATIIDLPVQSKYINPLGTELVDTEFGINIESHKNAANLNFNSKIDCSNASDIGIEIDMNRNADGWVYLYWSSTPHFSAEQYLKRWYPSGKIQAQFAFPNSIGGIYVRLLPFVKQTSQVQITKLTIYCLP